MFLLFQVRNKMDSRLFAKLKWVKNYSRIPSYFRFPSQLKLLRCSKVLFLPKYIYLRNVLHLAVDHFLIARVFNHSYRDERIQTSLQTYIIPKISSHPKIEKSFQRGTTNSRVAFSGELILKRIDERAGLFVESSCEMQRRDTSSNVSRVTSNECRRCVRHLRDIAVCMFANTRRDRRRWNVQFNWITTLRSYAYD